MSLIEVVCTECSCGWKVPRNVLLSAYGADDLREAEITYDCPVCAREHFIEIRDEGRQKPGQA